jgi:hypothetical protein
MKLTHAGTQLGVTFKVVEWEDTDILGMIQDPKLLQRVTDCVNADRRQKVALVAGRYDLSVLIGAGTEPDGSPIEGLEVKPLGFARTTKTASKNNETVYLWKETENEHINRFVDALVDGSVTPPGWTMPSGDNKVKETHAIKFLQTLADTCGDDKFTGTTEDAEGLKTSVTDAVCYILDITKEPRKGGTGLIPKWAMDTADLIINANLAEKSRAKHMAGYTNSTGITIDPIVCGELRTPEHHHTPEEKEQVHQSNRKTIAKWCYAARAQENEKRAATAVADFA